jgi:hypothetical protein
LDDPRDFTPMGSDGQRITFSSNDPLCPNAESWTNPPLLVDAG